MAMDKDKDKNNNDNVVAFEQTKRNRQKQNAGNGAVISSDVQKKPVKRRRNRPDLEKFGEEFTEPGDNARYLRFARVSMSLPPIDISDPKQVEKRINEYFDFCEENDRKPNMVGLANWIGVSRETVNLWKRGDYRSSTHFDVIRKAVDILEEIWVDYMQNGKINPASGIFLAKNMFQYKDVQDVVISPQNGQEQEKSVEDVRKWLEEGRVETEFADGKDGAEGAENGL